MAKRAVFSEVDAARILRRYNAVTVLKLLQEVATCDNARLDWNILVRESSTGICSAREYQALWRHIAYRAELADSYADDEQPSDDGSDLEFELLPSPAASSEAGAEAVRWVKTDMQRFDIGGKKKEEIRGTSRPRDAGLPTVSYQAHLSSGLSGSARDESYKGASTTPHVTARDSNTGLSWPGIACRVSLATPECTQSQVALGQIERKKRKLWSQEEDQELILAVEKFGEGNWTNILKGSFTRDRTAAQLSQRWALIRKRREVQAAANKLTVSGPNGQGIGVQTDADDPGLQTNSTQNGSNSSGIFCSLLPPTTGESDMASVLVDEVVALGSDMASVPSSSGSQSQDCVSSPNSSLGSTAVNGNTNGLVVGGMNSSALKGGVGTSMRAGMNGSQQLAHVGGTGRSTSGSSTAVTALAVGQSCSAGVGAGRLLAPGALVMSAAAAQATSVGGSEMWQAATLPTAGALASGPTKFVVRSNSAVATVRGMSSKLVTGPDPGVQAAAVAAGARIAPASAAASLLKAAHSGNVVHIRPGGVPVTRPGLPSQTGMGHNSSAGPRGSSGAIVHYICTGATPPTLQGPMLSGQRPSHQAKQQAMKAMGDHK